ncbi:MAG: DUF4139 domain-containing protein [Cytophagaceae bacterium]|nr:DUF4139 domain-containing protein [Cytophagaceae bacterium]
MASKTIQRLIILAMLSLQVCTMAADDNIRTASAKLGSATVFLQGAELTHIVKTSLTKGDNEIIIERLSPEIEENTLRISITGGVTVVSYSFSQDYLTEPPVEAAIKRLNDSIDHYTDELAKVNARLQINDDLLKLLKANNSIGGAQTGVSVAELVKMMDYYESKSSELISESNTYTVRKTKITEKFTFLRQQLALEERKNDAYSGRLRLKLLSPQAGDCTITVSYYTEHAQWTPCYDLQMSGIDKPLKIVYKADISQTTGLDWDKVRLTLSTIVPSRGRTAPMPEAWFLRYVSAPQKRQEVMMQNSLSYKVYDEVELEDDLEIYDYEMEDPPEVIDRLYVVDGVVMSYKEFEAIDVKNIKDVNLLKDASATAIYGSRARNGVVIITTKTAMDDYVTSEESEMDLTYTIDIPYTIAGNGNPQNVQLRTAEVDAAYSYYCAPMLDHAVYLTASVKNWGALNLLAGKANITIEGSYTGTTFINPNSTRETLDLTLGHDSRVTVKREKIQDLSSVKFLGSDVRQEFAYRTSVISTRTSPVRMILKEQYPLSTQKDIVVEVLVFTGKPHENKEIGTLTWEFDLTPAKTETFDISYSVKYPKGRKLNL